MSEQQKIPTVAMKVLIVVALAVAVGAAIVAKNASKEDAGIEAVSQQGAPQTAMRESTAPTEETAAAKPDAQETPARKLPRLVDLGSKNCIPCKMMEPILEELKEEYQDKFEVVFIDVWENKSAGGQYGIRVIPTQIFFDAEGKELFRHEGFYSKEDILGKWKELGLE